LLGCRYHGFNQPQPIGSLARSATLPAVEIAHELNMSRPPSGVVPNCPADFGETYLLRFAYADGHPLAVRFNHGGCVYVTNGDVTRLFAPVTLTRQLESALGQERL
jgi:hypothetical protein